MERIICLRWDDILLQGQPGNALVFIQQYIDEKMVDREDLQLLHWHCSLRPEEISTVVQRLLSISTLTPALAAPLPAPYSLSAIFQKLCSCGMLTAPPAAFAAPAYIHRQIGIIIQQMDFVLLRRQPTDMISVMILKTKRWLIAYCIGISASTTSTTGASCSTSACCSTSSTWLPPL